MDGTDTPGSRFDVRVEELVDLMRMPKGEALEMLQRMKGPRGLCEVLRTDFYRGLSTKVEDANARREYFGQNDLPSQRTKSFLKHMFNAMGNIVTALLIAVSLSSLVMYLVISTVPEDPATEHLPSTGRRWIDMVSVLLVVTAVGLVSAGAEYTKRSKFRQLLKNVERERTVNVKRAGVKESIRCQDVLVGDVIMLTSGNVAPADGVLLSSFDMKAEEISLSTGQMFLVMKSVAEDPFIRAGSSVIDGEGTMLALVVGPESTIGQMLANYGMEAFYRFRRASTVPPDSDPSLVVMEKEPIVRTSEFVRRRKEEGAQKASCLCRISRWIRTRFTKVLRKVSGDENKSGIDVDFFANDSALITKLRRFKRALSLLVTVYATVIITLIVVEYRRSHLLFREEYLIWTDFIRISSIILLFLAILAAGIPDGLSLTLTFSITYAVAHMLNDNSLVRNVQACERIAHTSVIFCDKTGTLTTNKMTVMKISFGKVAFDLNGESSLMQVAAEVKELLARAISICSSYGSNIEYRGYAKFLIQSGNRAECALLDMVNSTLGFQYVAFRREFPESTFLRKIPYNSRNKFMATAIPLQEGGDSVRVYVRGASDVLRRCVKGLDHTGQEYYIDSNKETYEMLWEVVGRMSAGGLKVVLIAYKDIYVVKGTTPELNIQTMSTDLTLIAILGVEDTIRKEVPDAVETCLKAGIDVRIVTVDTVSSTRYVALKCNILKPYDGSYILTGNEFDQLIRGNDGRIEQRRLDVIWPKLRILARCTPEQKYLVVRAVKESEMLDKRKVVAVIGDGTNDALALREAHVGFAMGMIGSDVARESSDIILTDDDFTSVIRAFMWGISIIEAVQRYIQLHATFALSLVNVTLLAVAFRVPVPLMSVHMLWMNLFLDTLGCLALTTEHPSGEFLDRKHRHGGEVPLFNVYIVRGILGHLFYQLAVMEFIVFYGDEKLDITHSQRMLAFETSEKSTFLFATFLMMNLFNEINCRRINGERNVFDNMASCPIFMSLWVVKFFFASHVLYVGAELFRTEALATSSWAWALCFGVGSLLWHQIILTIPLPTLSRFLHKSCRRLNELLQRLQHTPTTIRVRGQQRPTRKKSRRLSIRRRKRTTEEERWQQERFKLLVDLEKIRRRVEAEWEEEVKKTPALQSYKEVVEAKKPWKAFVLKKPPPESPVDQQQQQQ